MGVLQGGVVSTSPNPQAGGSPLSAIHDCLFKLFAATLHFGGRSSIRNLRTRHAVVTNEPLPVEYNSGRPYSRSARFGEVALALAGIRHPDCPALVQKNDEV